MFLNPPFDWRFSLKDNELTDIAQSSIRLANDLNSCVQIIWFVGIPADLGHPPLLPFFYTLEDPPVASRGNQLDDKSLYKVRDHEDLVIMRSKAARSESLPPVLRLKPKLNLIRSREFLEEVAEFANHLNLSIELEGSILSHAFYILKSKGIPVVCIDPFLPKYKKVKHRKLVRDLIPARISAQGETVKIIEVVNKQLPNLLKTKVLEEAYELFWAEQPADMLEELADIYEIVRTFASKLDISIEDLRKLADKKKNERGGFEHGLILDETEENPLIRIEDHSLSSLLHSNYSKMIIENQLPKSFNIINEPHVKNNNLVIPLIPPSPSRRHLSTSIPLEYLNIIANISFHEKKILVTLTRPQHDSYPAVEKTLQLSLFSTDSTN